ncbi:MAG TPA: DUF2961 domain-containing protein [Phycisphaerae bacterium]|nr:DUF2961 domain-containing protein [Phycisphaerae bacterium]
MGCRHRATVLLVLAVVATPIVATAQPGYVDYTSWSDWARLRVGVRAGLASSYDRTGGNSDYSQYEWPEGLIRDDGVVCTVKTLAGPGVVHRFWMPHKTADQSFVVRMYFDGEVTPRIDTTSDVLLDGSFGYFTAPLVTTCAGGQVSYEPIPFAGALRIETVNKLLPASGWSPNRHYYQYTYSLYPVSTDLTSYDGTLTPEQQSERAAVAALFDNAGQHPGGSSPGAVVVTTPAGPVPAGGSIVLADVTGPGLVRRINVRMDAATDDELDGLRLAVTYDDGAAAAIDVSVANFFGAGHLRASYAGLPLGTDSPDGFYCYWPMPFRQRVRVSLVNSTGSPVAIDSAVVEYEPGPVATDMCYLHASAYTHVCQAAEVYHPIISVTGRGHYAGNLLYVEQDAWSFAMLEGDEVITVDGTETLYGTGLEDAYNGGYYYNWTALMLDEPEGPRPESAIRPLHGILYVHHEDGVEYARADQFRWYIADRVGFSSSIEVKVENRYAQVGSVWTSVGFWYQQPPVPADTDGDGDLDLSDFAALQRCFGESSPACTGLFDLDGSGLVDLPDYEDFSEGFTGPWE